MQLWNLIKRFWVWLFGSEFDPRTVTLADTTGAPPRRLQSVSVTKNDYRKNTRGLPRGIGRHQVKAARRIKNAVANNPDANIGDTRIHAAETVLNVVKRNAAIRAQYPRPSKLARRLANAR